MNCPKAQAVKGWTLIETLVVIAVIAILISILIPFFGRSREQTYRTQCASNLKQFATAFSMYASDWEGYWPGPGGLKGDRCYWSQTGNGGLQSYIKQRGQHSVWCCPLAPEWTGPYPARTYSMNSYLRTPADYEYPKCVTYPWCLDCQGGIKADAIEQPTRTILLFEGMPLTDGQRESLDYLYRCANWTRTRGFADKIANTIDPGKPWHGLYNNYLYCDGHIVARKPGRPTASLYSTGKEMYEWYVDKGGYMDNYRNIIARVAPWE